MIKKITFKYGASFSERYGSNSWVAGIFDDTFIKTDYYLNPNTDRVLSITNSFTDNWDVEWTEYEKSDFYNVSLWLTAGQYVKTITLTEVVSPTREELLEFFNMGQISNQKV